MECCVDLGLMDINYSGLHCTWTNKSISSKIDRAMGNNLWFDKGLNASARFLPVGCVSDHASGIVSLSKVTVVKPSFMFFNMWNKHESFNSIVEDS